MILFFLAFLLADLSAPATLHDVLENVHRLMTEIELDHYFGVSRGEEVPEYEVLYLKEYRDPQVAKRGSSTSPNRRYRFNAFERDYDLLLQPNRWLLSPDLKVEVVNEDGRILKVNYEPKPCHFMHNNGGTKAAISLCTPGRLSGFIIEGDRALQIHPFSPRLHNQLESLGIKGDEERGHPHLLLLDESHHSLTGKGKGSFCGVEDHGSSFWDKDLSNSVKEFQDIDRDYVDLPKDVEAYWKKVRGTRNNSSTVTEIRRKKGAGGSLTVELGVFLDTTATNQYRTFYGYNETAMTNYIANFLNAVQVVYLDSSMNTKVTFTVVAFRSSKELPGALKSTGERMDMLEKFCAYAEKENKGTDKDPTHWDMAIQLTGLDMWGKDAAGQASFATMGLAYVGGICSPKVACVVAEFGVRNGFGKPYPSSGYSSIYVLAHEIGHNLGMSHDGSGESAYCQSEGNIMSPSKGLEGETTWSKCSAQVVNNLLNDVKSACLDDKDGKVDSAMTKVEKGYPGEIRDMDGQCQDFIMDEDAFVKSYSELSNYCSQLQCRTPWRTGFYSAGPALEYSYCGSESWCRGGKCQKWTAEEKSQRIIRPGQLTGWASSPCRTKCIEGAMGYMYHTRTCTGRKNTIDGCEGNRFEVELCNPSSTACLDKDKKGWVQSKEAYATAQCREFATKGLEYLINAATTKGHFENYRADAPWQACSIYCLDRQGRYYSPQQELNDLSTSAYFPDGTPCHKAGDVQYYCIARECQRKPDGGRMAILKSTLANLPIYQNALPRTNLSSFGDSLSNLFNTTLKDFDKIVASSTESLKELEKFPDLDDAVKPK